MWLLFALLAWGRAPDLLLFTLDTTRADALSCDDAALRPGTTPEIDRVAAEGLRLTRFYTHAPSTLSAHASLMTGRDPHQHGVPRNGYPLEPSALTLAERLRAEGYQTRAVVSASVLAREMGLARGFEEYDERFVEKSALVFQDRAEGAAARAIAAIRSADPEQPLFLWVHFYDPHAPYEPPAPYDARFADPAYRGGLRGDAASLRLASARLEAGTLSPEDGAQVVSQYLGEVASVDAQLGRVLAAARAAGRLDRALVVITADHGETLLESPIYAFSHGTQVSPEVTRVPLVLRGYGIPLGARAVVTREAAMSGLAPTLERALGLTPALGRDFWDLVRPGPRRLDEGWPEVPGYPVLLEASRPRQVEVAGAWNNLAMERGVRAGGAFARAIPYLGEVLRIEEGATALLPALTALLARWDAASPPFRAMTQAPEVEAALTALGYLEPSSGSAGASSAGSPGTR